MRCKDQMGRWLELAEKPSRIISLVPSQTELLVDLGLEDLLVGITKFCIHPTQLRKKVTVVGGTKKINLQKIIALKPHLIICNKEENTKEMVEELSQYFPVWLSDIYKVEDSLEMIMSLGTIFNVVPKAQEICNGISLEMSKFETFIGSKKNKKVAYLIWKNPYMVAGKNTFIDALLKLNKFDNAFLDRSSRYPEVQEEELGDVELILLSSEPYPFKQEEALLLAKRTKVPVILVDGEYFSWYGSRLHKAFSYFKSLH